MYKLPDYHKSLEVLHWGCESPHAYFIPAETREKAASELRENSAFFASLNGTWDFKYYSFVAELEDITADGFEFPEKIEVPRSWQTYTDRGYDPPQYVAKYPFTIDPPHVPDENPCGVYSRDFRISADILASKRIHLNFEGVDSCFYLWVNGRFAAYSQVSHALSEIDITDYLTEGKNSIKVTVLKWCDGSYFEDQDMWRMSGIFRDVYLLYRDPVHISDVYIKPRTGADLTEGTVTLEIKTNGDAEVAFGFEDANGNVIAEGKTASGKAFFTVSHPLLWSDEAPNLYSLYLYCGGEIIHFDVGFKNIEIKNKTVFINSQKVKIRGVNRHDSHPQLGHTVTYEHMRNDLLIMKAHNINCVRTSHYPPDPRFIRMCDRLGLYVCDEADFETQGFLFIDDWGRLSDDLAWEAAYIDRTERMVERDKNSVSVIIWSLGNESGLGRNHHAQTAWIRSRDGSRIVFYDGAHTKYAGGKNLTEVTDLESRMYPRYDYPKEYIENPEFTSPLFMPEFCHSMGNSAGDFKYYWELVLKYDEFLGGCVWEYCDHSVVTFDENGKPQYKYGGDFGDESNLFNICVDGMVYPDRTPHTALLEYKNVIMPISASLDEASRRITVKNLRCFTDLSDVELVWTVEKNGKVIIDGSLPSLGIPLQEEREFELDYRIDGEGYYYLDLYFRQNIPTEWAEVGHELGFRQFGLEAAEPICSAAPKASNVSLTEDERFITVSAGENMYRFDKVCGYIDRITSGGADVIREPVIPSVWRAPIDNDARSVMDEWVKNGINTVKFKCYTMSVTEASESRVEITVTGKTRGHTTPYMVDLPRLLVEVANGKTDCDSMSELLDRYTKCILEDLRVHMLNYAVRMLEASRIGNEPMRVCALVDDCIARGKSIFERGGIEMQVNVIDLKTLIEAREHPELHSDIIVRIGGYSDYFVRLGAALKQEIIDRTEY